ncbi:hypothetical protein METBIDRAFT_41006 [Metschnikowia bicuspidata var. bicuspidata NRRL YB-4993]|uniref:Uncharacterized protein n=1 Tax=Metschnikowia bicuspidata var. bicuspidata NRRL YB-4993 TaxID=869754 RepID=A0A1A0HCP8_9ASCO|nr:hypothetical protein METBIDRAFT_41006 [Metschnikowia bicuspidata var. bicuspidata NRRL YB-4993]OBA21693.1 hypothetical protein METBIDRAFT_41006 [Metschnikowia bicuspidata var. bicuspidata NRRL YB-4993]
MAASTTTVTEPQKTATSQLSSVPLHSARGQTEVVNDLIKIIELEFNKGNRTVTEEKYAAFLKLRDLQKPQQRQEKPGPPTLPTPLYPTIFQKFQPPQKSLQKKENRVPLRQKNQSWSFKYIETTLIAVLEAIASILDNLHLLSKMPMFPKSLVHVLNHTNRIWVLILVFLIRKTISQLLNVRRKERKVASELAILKSNANSKLLEQGSRNEESNIFRRYEKVLKDLKFDKTMLKIELLGNILDLAFNVIELYALPVPAWFMSILNMASIAMTVYRMNKDDEYIDDDVSEDLI